MKISIWLLMTLLLVTGAAPTASALNIKQLNRMLDVIEQRSEQPLDKNVQLKAMLQKQNDDLIDAAKRKDFDTVIKLINEGADINVIITESDVTESHPEQGMRGGCSDVHGKKTTTPLIALAIESNRPDLVKLLIEKNVDLTQNSITYIFNSHTTYGVNQPHQQGDYNKDQEIKQSMRDLANKTDNQEIINLLNTAIDN